MNRLLLSFMLAIAPISITLAETNDPCQTLANVSAQSVLNCYKKQTDAQLQNAKNKFIAEFVASLGSSAAMPNAKDGMPSLSNQFNGQNTDVKQEQAKANNQTVKYY